MTDVTAPLFRALDREIALASLYVATLIAWAELYGPGDLHGPLRVACWAACGFVAGVMAGFRNRADPRRNLCDALMVVVWTVDLLLAVNLIAQLGRLAELAVLFAWFAGAALLGSLLGEPLLTGIASFSVRERRPPHRNVRFVARVLLYTLTAGLVLSTAAAVAFPLFVILLLALGGAILSVIIKALLTPGKPS